jgi:hypothetical protein
MFVAFAERTQAGGGGHRRAAPARMEISSGWGGLEMLAGGSVVSVEHKRVSEIPGVGRWSYGTFQEDHERGSRTVPLHRDDGKSAEFTVPDFVANPEDLRSIATVVIGALEKWESVKGLGA